MAYGTYETDADKCACGRHVGDLDPDHHDGLLGVERDGAAGLARLVELVVLEVDNGPAPGELRLNELTNFISLHNWQDPEAMTRLGRMLEYLGTLASEAQRAHEAADDLTSEPPVSLLRTDEIQVWLDGQGGE